MTCNKNYFNVEFISGDEVEVVANTGGDKIFDWLATLIIAEVANIFIPSLTPHLSVWTFIKQLFFITTMFKKIVFIISYINIIFIRPK